MAAAEISLPLRVPDAIRPISVEKADVVANRTSELVVLCGAVTCTIAIVQWDPRAHGPYMAQVTYTNVMLNTIMALYIRLGSEWFPLGIRLLHRWGTGWEIVVPYSFGLNVFVPLAYYSWTPNFEVASILSHMAFPALMLVLCMTHTLTTWTGRLHWFDVLTSVLSIVLFMLCNMIFNRLVADAWPYEEGERLDLATWQDAALATCGIVLLLLLSLGYYAACRRLSLRPRNDALDL